MTTSEGVREAWDDLVWRNATVLAISSKAHPYDATIARDQIAQPEKDKWYHDAEINFFQYHVDRSVSDYKIGGSAEYQFKVLVEYFREVNPEGTNRNTCADALETIFSTVLDDLGSTWNDTVDFWRPQEGPFEVTTTTLDGKQCWKGSMIFTGFKTSTLA